MSVISIQFGQCGNQIGHKLYSTIYKDLKSQAKTKNDDNHTQILNKWFSVTDAGEWEPRSILVDTENKVVDFNLDKRYQFKHVVAKSYGGSANNWGFGYSERSRLLQNEVVDCVRMEAEKSDSLTHILNIYSSSGGTGSGVGSRIIEILRDQYPTKPLINAVILPFLSGEVVTQSYNTILSLSKLYGIADSNILFQNDELHYICHNNMDIKNITFSNINDIVAQQIYAAYQPLKGVSSMTRDWSVADRRKLLLALQQYGATDLESIQADLPDKSINEIRFVIDNYSRRAYSKFKGLDKVENEEVSLSMWIKVLEKLDTKKNAVPDVLPRVLKYIALYEKKVSSDVNLSDCYMVLSDMLRGNPPKEMDEKTTYFFYHCLMKLAESLKNSNIDGEKEFLKNLKLLECGKPTGITYSRKKFSKNLNPLEVPDHLLTRDIKDAS